MKLFTAVDVIGLPLSEYGSLFVIKAPTKEFAAMELRKHMIDDHLEDVTLAQCIQALDRGKEINLSGTRSEIIAGMIT